MISDTCEKNDTIIIISITATIATPTIASRLSSRQGWPW